jgi:thiol-disulfide isomerase/thioredoxin
MKNKKIVISTISMILYLLIVINATAQIKKGFELKGNIEGLKDGSFVYLILETDTVLTTKSLGSKFEFHGYVEGGANWYGLKLDTTINKGGKNPTSNALWLTNSKLLVDGNINDWKKLSLIGSKPHDEYMQVINFYRENKENKVMMDSFYIDFIRNHPNSLYVSDLIIKSTFLLTERGLENSYNNLTQEAKNSYYGIELRKIIEGAKGVKAMQKNNTSLDFNITGIDGRKVSILDVASKSKYTLIDFWASWCIPCRAAIPKLKKVYETFSTKGFNIIGISRDKNEADWRRALLQENMPWIQGLDNVHNAGTTIFNLAAIPAYILVDQNGKIIQTDYFVSGEKTKVFKENEKSLGKDLYEIIEVLLGEGKIK